MLSRMCQGMTAHYLACGTVPLQSSDTCLVHAAAGGVGTILCQWANHLGATVIGTVGSPGKARLAKAALAAEEAADAVAVATALFAPAVSGTPTSEDGFRAALAISSCIEMM